MLGGRVQGLPVEILDGRPLRASADGLLCGGKWGNCCSKYGYCGTGTNYCSLENCYSGDCEIPVRPNNGLPWLTGTTRNESCGGAEGYTCDVAFGNCCSKDGVCGALVEHCGTGCSAKPTSTRSSTSSFPSATKVSTDGSCGGSDRITCKGSTFGNCCSSAGYCGSSSDYCGAGRQSAFGDATPSPTNLSTDGSCGGANKYRCPGSAFGDCCSPAGYCGSSTGHCGAGCQSAFGTCSVAADVSPDGTCGGANGYKCAGWIQLRKLLQRQRVLRQLVGSLRHGLPAGLRDLPRNLAGRHVRRVERLQVRRIRIWELLQPGGILRFDGGSLRDGLPGRLWNVPRRFDRWHLRWRQWLQVRGLDFRKLLQRDWVLREFGRPLRFGLPGGFRDVSGRLDRRHLRRKPGTQVQWLNFWQLLLRRGLLRQFQRPLRYGLSSCVWDLPWGVDGWYMWR
ncbi:hypothetical protein CPLU01_00382 [Colletotrichum plurivorum]|uniref:Chitin-binding type-1 domain-containing protein n=1 Tax=Colletotrichum plurivorum TaxID=2175906 RepID=A0A8H6U6H3_9PEZI|nr:hypothetical protein CPLU01_00382 [Colletotrichum plurivorum]